MLAVFIKMRFNGIGGTRTGRIPLYWQPAVAGIYVGVEAAPLTDK